MSFALVGTEAKVFHFHEFFTLKYRWSMVGSAKTNLEGSIMKQLFVSVTAIAVLIVMGASSGWCEEKPDFTNSEAVFKDMRAKLDQCSTASAKNCMVSCGYGLKTLKNFIKANPGGDPSIMKQRWQPCFEAHRDADIKAPVTAKEETAPAEPAEKAEKPSHDRSKFVVSQLQLGGSMKPHEGRFFLLEAYGHHNNTNAEHWDAIKSKTSGEQPGPDIVKGYKGMIREKPVYIHFEADADGRIYMIQFKQKESMDVDPVKESLIARYGKPNKHHGSYMYWGCDRGPQEGFCVKASVTTNNLEIWAFDEDIKNAAKTAYENKILASQGIKKGPKF